MMFYPQILARISGSIRNRFNYLRRLHEKDLTVEEFDEEEEKQGQFCSSSSSSTDCSSS